ncbi:MAG: hypothetical protein WD651_02510 [Acidimicrobiia bacterium]
MAIGDLESDSGSRDALPGLDTSTGHTAQPDEDSPVDLKRWNEAIVAAVHEHRLAPLHPRHA